MTARVLAGLAAATMIMLGGTGTAHADTPSPTPSAARTPAIPASLKGLLTVSDRVDENTGGKILIERELPCPDDPTVGDPAEWATQTLRPQNSSSSRPVGSKPSAPVTSLLAGETLPGRLCDSGEPLVVKEGKIFRTSAVPAFDQQTTSDLLAGGTAGIVVQPVRVDLEPVLYEQPGALSEPVATLAVGDRLTRIGPAYGGQHLSSLRGATVVFAPAETAAGETGWLPTQAISPVAEAGQVWGDLPTRQITVGTAVPPEGIPVYLPSTPVDPAAVEPPSDPGTEAGRLRSGDRVTVSESTWGRPSGSSWLSLAGQADRAAQLPPEKRYLAETLSVVEVPGQAGVLGWTAGWADLDLVAPTGTATPSGTETPATPTATIDPTAEVNFDRVVQRVGGVHASLYAIRSLPTADGPRLGKLEAGISYPAGGPADSEGISWTPIQVAGSGGDPVTGWVHSEDVIVMPGVSPSSAPEPGSTWWQRHQAEKAEPSPLGVAMGVLPWAGTGFAGLLSLGLLSVGWRRAQAKVAGVLSIPSSPVGFVLRLAPTTLGTAAAALAAALAPVVWAGVLAAVLLGALAGATASARAASYRRIALADLRPSPRSMVIAGAVAFVVMLVVGLVVSWPAAIVLALGASGAALGAAAGREVQA